MAIGEMASDLPLGFNDRISSVRIFGNATATLCNDRNFGGIRLPLTRNIADLRNIPTRDNPSKNWNNWLLDHSPAPLERSVSFFTRC